MGMSIDKLFCVNNKRMHYLLVGCWNALFGYGVAVALLYSLSSLMHTVFIGIIINIFTISMSFITYKLLVFKTKGNWLQEYLRSWTVYAGTALTGLVLLWIMVDYFRVKIWLAQGIIMIILVIITYICHSRFTFKRNTINRES